MEVTAVKETAAHWLKQFWPTLTMSNSLRFGHLSRDPKMDASYKSDSLRHRKVSAPLYLGMREAMTEVQSHAASWNADCPLLLQIAGQDKVVDSQESMAFAERVSAPNKKIHLYEDSYHEIYNDINRPEVMGHMYDFLGEIPL